MRIGRACSPSRAASSTKNSKSTYALIMRRPRPSSALLSLGEGKCVPTSPLDYCDVQNSMRPAAAEYRRRLESSPGYIYPAQISQLAMFRAPITANFYQDADHLREHRKRQESRDSIEETYLA
jgi:hypothetical protein